MRAVVAALGAGVAITVAAVETIPPPQGFWPVTVVGWMTAFLSLAGVITTLYGVHRFSQKPLVAALVKLESHFDEKIKIEHEYVDVQLKQIRRDTEIQMNHLSIALKERMDGFGMRVGDVEDEHNSMVAIMNGVVKDMASSIEDRRHINTQLAMIIASQESSHRDRVSFERDLLKIITDIRRQS